MARLYGFKGMEAECFVEPIRAWIAPRFEGRFIVLLAAHLWLFQQRRTAAKRRTFHRWFAAFRRRSCRKCVKRFLQLERSFLPCRRIYNGRISKPWPLRFWNPVKRILRKIFNS